MPKIVVLGEALIDIFAEKGVALRDARTLHPSPGGAPANVAVALARLGADVGFIGKVGVDDYGEFLIDLLASEGVDTTYFVTDPRKPTMVAIVALPSSTEQHFIIHNGANTLLTADEIPKSYVTDAAFYIYSSITLASESRQAALEAAEWARGAGRQVIFDVNLRPLVWDNLENARYWIAQAIATATVIKLNETELEFVTGATDPASGSQHLIERGVQLCCVSLGAKGAYFNNGSVTGYIPAFSLEVHDTTGSGDAFVAGLVYQLCTLDQAPQGMDLATLKYVAVFANACGGLAATQIGAMSALPRLEDVKQLLA
ncbi:carbohydrate kinase [Chloroflexi bacterium TSY]|nr:carbohydrate kinase [Chloroflexi bacterium TSY]